MAEYIYKPDLEKHVMVRQEEIIRCCDCKHKDDWLDEGGQCGVDPDGFCAWAERRDA